MEANDPKFDGFRRDYLDIFQQQAEMHVLANHAASDACAFTLYEYADMARYTPQLVKGLTALDLVRETLDRYLSGFLGYGLPGYKGFDTADPGDSQEPYVFTDVYPSLLISAYDYADGSGDEQWLRRNYLGLRKWTETMTAANADGSPLLEYPASGDSGSWPQKIAVRPANWWDTIGFGHQDAYSNALGYRALRSMAALADRIGETADAQRYRKRAEEIHAAYAAAFLDPSAGVLAGMEKPRRPVAQLLLSFRQRHCGAIRAYLGRAGSPGHGSHPRQNAKCGIQKLRLRSAREPGADPACRLC